MRRPLRSLWTMSTIVLGSLVPTAPSARMPPPGRDVQRVYVQLKNRCEGVFSDPLFKASPNRIGLYRALQDCVQTEHQKILAAVGPVTYSRSILLSNALILDLNTSQRRLLLK